MTNDDLGENLLGELTLAEAEKRFHEAMELLSWATDELRTRVQAGEMPDTVDVAAMRKELGDAWRAFQRERDFVAEYRRKNGGLVDGDLDFGTARAAVCEQLDRIATSLETE